MRAASPFLRTFAYSLIGVFSLVERQIESGVDFGIEVFVVDRRGNHTVVDRKDAGQRLDSTGMFFP